MEFASDPNGDGKVKDRVDLINMSLGSDYGQPFDDDLSAAVNVTKFGILTVASAGNWADKPYVGHTCFGSNSPFGRADERSKRLPAVDAGNSPALIVEITRQSSSPGLPLATIIPGLVQYGDGAGGNLDGCAPFALGLWQENWPG